MATKPTIKFNMVAKAPTPVAKTPTQVPVKIVSNPSGATPNPLGNKVADSVFKATNVGSGGLQQKAAAQAMGVKSTPAPSSNAKTTYTTNTPDKTPTSPTTTPAVKNAPKGNFATNTGTTEPTTDISQAGLIQELIRLQQGLYPKAEKTAADIANLKKQLATQLGNTYQNPIPLEFQTGRAQTLQNMAAQKETALQGQLSNQIGIANAGAGMLNSAIGATAPTSNIILRNPQTGEPIGNQNLGNMAFQQGQIQAQGSQGAEYQKYSADLASGQNQVQGLNSFIQSNGVNPTDFVKVNDLINRISQQVGSPNYQKLQNYLSGINGSYSSILGYNVDVNTIAKQSGQSIASVIQALDQQAQAKIAGLKSTGTGQANTYQASGSDIYNF